jgi:hypothetical protein
LDSDLFFPDIRRNEDAFYAVNKLVQSANGSTIQKQMTQSMNETIANMCIPGVGNPMERPAEKPEKSEEKKSNEN